MSCRAPTHTPEEYESVGAKVYYGGWAGAIAFSAAALTFLLARWRGAETPALIVSPPMVTDCLLVAAAAMAQFVRNDLVSETNYVAMGAYRIPMTNCFRFGLTVTKGCRYMPSDKGTRDQMILGYLRSSPCNHKKVGISLYCFTHQCCPRLDKPLQYMKRKLWACPVSSLRIPESLSLRPKKSSCV